MYGLQPIVKPTFTAANRHLMRARRYVFLLPSPQVEAPGFDHAPESAHGFALVKRKI